MDRKILLLDVSHMMFRAFFSVPDNMTAPDGTHTGACHGFFNILVKAVENLDPDLVVACWDRGKPAHRTEALPEYKSGRAPMDEHLKKQFPIVHELLDVIGICQLEMNGFEADDMIGSSATLNTAEGHFSFILSGDHDMLQLVSSTVNAVAAKAGELVIYDETRVEEEYGIKPSQYLDFASFRGDPADRVPGCPGIGSKTAAKLIQEFGTLENIIDAAQDGKIPGKNGERIRDNYKQILMSKEVMAIHRDLPIDMDWDATWGKFEYDKIADAFKYYGLLSVLRRLARHEGGNKSGKTMRADTYRDVIDATEEAPDEDAGLQQSLF